MPSLIRSPYCLVLFLAIGLPLRAQVTDAALSGNVLDSTGAAIPKASVIAENTGTGVRTQSASNDAGRYMFPALPPGQYRLTVAAPGFRTTTYEGLQLEVAARLTLNAELEIAPASNSIDVHADADSQLAYSTSSVGGTVTGRKVLELPLTTRNALGLVFIHAGLVGDNFSGARIGTLNIQVDGINVQDARINSGVASMIFPSTDRIEEFRVITSPADAELGRGSGQIQMITRSGSNQFHGSLFEFHRNTVLNANTFFNNLRGNDPVTGELISPRDILIRNQFGARLGGPVRRNRTFFHVLYEGQRIRARNAVTALVYTADARRGLFRFFPNVQNGNADSISPTVNYSGNPINPSGALSDLQTVSVFGRDPARLTADPTGLIEKQFSFMPLPNNFRAGDGLNTAGFTWSRPASDDRNQFNLKLDHNLSNAHRMAFSWSRDTAASFNTFLAQNYPLSPGGSTTEHKNVYSLSVTSALRPTLVNELRVGALRPANRSNAPWESEQGRRALPQLGNYPFLFIFQSVTGPIARTNDPQGRISPNYQFSDRLSYLRGKHNVKVGGQVWFVSSNGFNSFDVLPRLAIGAGGVPVQNFNTIPGIGRNQTLAQSLLLNLSGSIDNAVQAFNSPGGANPAFLPGEGKQRTWRQREFAFFFQDDVKITSNLTVNLGLRYEWFGVPWDANGRTAGLVGGSASIFGLTGSAFADIHQPGRLAGGLTQLELVGPRSPNPGRKLYNNDWNNFAPAIGLAWNLPRFRSAFRAGYSIGYERDSLRLVDIISGDQPGLRSAPLFVSGNALNLTNVRLPLPVTEQPLALVPLTDRSQTVRAFDTGLRTPYVQNWNVSIDRELPGRAVFSARYVGNKGTRLIRGTSVNETTIYENGVLDAFRITQAGGNAPLLDRILMGLNIAGIGRVDGRTVTGSQIFRLNATTQSYLAHNGVGDFARYLNLNTFLTGERGGMLRNGRLPENFIVANPQFDSARLFSNFASSTYHSLQLEVVKRFTRGWTLQANYTWSKALGEEEGSDQEQLDSYRDLRNWRMDKRLLGFHRTHVIRTNAIWELPFGPGKPLLKSVSGVAGKIVGGWQIGSIFNVFSGGPMTVVSGVSTLNTFGDNTPVAVGDIDKSLGVVTRRGNGVVYFPELTQVVDPGVASLPPDLRPRSVLRAIADSSGQARLITPQAGFLGTLAPGFFEGPGAFRLDVNLLKRIAIRDTKNVELSVILESATNSPSFDDPDLNMHSVTFGRIGGAGGNRIVVVGARFNF